MSPAPRQAIVSANDNLLSEIIRNNIEWHFDQDKILYKKFDLKNGFEFVSASICK